MSSSFSLFSSRRAFWNSFAWRRICPWICVAVISVLILKLQTGTSSRSLPVPAAYCHVFMLCYSEAHGCLCSSLCQLHCALSQLDFPEGEGCKVQSSCYKNTDRDSLSFMFDGCGPFHYDETRRHRSVSVRR